MTGASSEVAEKIRAKPSGVENLTLDRRGSRNAGWHLWRKRGILFVVRDLPSGTVTFLFTDIEGSTKLLRELGAERYAKALAEHRSLLREVLDAHGGVEVDTQGDAFFVAFPTAPGALEAASAAMSRLAAGQIRVRMGIHTGTPHLTDEGYAGADVHRLPLGPFDPAVGQQHLATERRP